MRLLYITSNRIGDAVLSSGGLAALLDQEPALRATVVCGPAPAPLFRAAPRVDQVIVLRKQPRARHWRELWLDCVRTRWHSVVDLRGSLIAWGLPARRRLTMRPDRSMRHRVEQLQDFLKLPRAPDPLLWLGDDDRAAARDRLQRPGPVLALGATANWEGKRWASDNFVELAHRLTAPEGPLPGGTILVAGAPDERSLVEDALQRLPSDRTVAVFEDNLMTTAACLAAADLFVGNDSGLMHVAAAAGIPVLGLFGPSRQEHYAPWGRNTAFIRTSTTYDEFISAPGYDRHTTPSLMGELTVDAVEAAALSLWRRAVPVS